MALLPVHSQNFASLRKNSSRTARTSACRRAIRGQRPVQHRGQVLTPRLLRRMGNCPPPTRRQLQSQPSNLAHGGTASRRAGQQRRQVRVLSWNTGHLGQQQWSEIKTWLASEADKHCDVLILQETHWTASAEFTVSGWYCVSSASPPDPSSSVESARLGKILSPKEGPSTTVADGVTVLFSPKFDKQKIRWRGWLQERVLEAGEGLPCSEGRHCTYRIHAAFGKDSLTCFWKVSVSSWILGS